jgi:hypothetical protein
MKYIILALMISACSTPVTEPTPPVEILPIRNCVQQPLDESVERIPGLNCKRGDWQQIGDPKCSSSLEICLKKKF